MSNKKTRASITLDDLLPVGDLLPATPPTPSEPVSVAEAAAASQAALAPVPAELQLLPGEPITPPLVDVEPADYSAFSPQLVGDDPLTDEQIINSPLHPKPVRPTLTAVPLDQLAAQWDNFMEWLPRQARDAVYATKITDLVALSTLPPTALKKPRGFFTPPIYAYVAEAMKLLGHPFQAAETAPRGRSGTSSHAARAAYVRRLRRG